MMDLGALLGYILDYQKKYIKKLYIREVVARHFGNCSGWNGEVGANRNAVNARAGGRAGPRQRMPNIWEGGISKTGCWVKTGGVFNRRRDEAFGGKALTPSTKHTE